MMHPAPPGVDVFAWHAVPVPVVDLFSVNGAKAHSVLLLIIPCEIITRELCVAAQIYLPPVEGFPPMAAIVIRIFLLFRNGLKMGLQKREGIMIDLELGNWKDFIEAMLRK